MPSSPKIIVGDCEWTFTIKGAESRSRSSQSSHIVSRTKPLVMPNHRSVMSQKLVYEALFLAGFEKDHRLVSPLMDK